MKKILLASTALVLSAGLAHAQAVTIGGQGRMGVEYDTNGYPGGTNWRIENRLQLNFAVAVEADHGLTFGAFTRARMQMAGVGGNGRSVNAPAMFSGSRVWVEANNFRLTFGNTDGAFRGAGASHGYLGGCGIGYEGGIMCWDSAGLLGFTQGFNSTGANNWGQLMRADYSMGDTRVALSHAQNGATEIGIRTSFDAFTVALGYTNGNNTLFNIDGNAVGGGTFNSALALSGHYNGGSWGAGLLVARISGGNDTSVGLGPVNYTNYSLSANADLGGGTAYGFVGRVYGATTYGLNYSYGLGGGASVVAGVEHINANATIGTGARTVASIGAVFNF